MIRASMGSRMREIDSTAINIRGIPGLQLMERAGEQLTERILAVMSEYSMERCVIVCGAGNNGGDGYVAARLMEAAGRMPEVFAMTEAEKLRGDALENYIRYTEGGGLVTSLKTEEGMSRFREACETADIVIDGILGTGISRNVSGTAEEIIRIVNESRIDGSFVMSVDIPSGIGADDGNVYGTAVKADETVTFQMNKYGMCIEPGRSYAGKVTVADIGLPRDLCDDDKGVVYIMDRTDAREFIPKRDPRMNKGSAGKLLIVAGSPGMAGAAVLAAVSAYRSGAGLVKVAAKPEVIRVIQCTVPEATCLILGDDIDENKRLISREAELYDAVVVGPGLGRSEEAGRLVRHIIRNVDKPMIIDADGLNLISDDPRVLMEAMNDVIITPHPGEMGRLLGCTPSEINSDRLNIAADFANTYGVVTVLKGAGSLIACPDGKVYMNPTGNSAMATAGSGDVLSGIAGAFLAAGVPVERSAAAAVYVHGMSGDICRDEKGEYATLASDLAAGAGEALRQLTVK